MKKKILKKMKNKLDDETWRKMKKVEGRLKKTKDESLRKVKKKDG